MIPSRRAFLEEALFSGAFAGLLLPAALLCFLLMTGMLRAQSFGTLINRKKIVLQRKLPPTGHIAGPTIKVVVTAHGSGKAVTENLKATLEDILIHNDAKLRPDDERGDTVINCTITGYSAPRSQATVQSTLVAKKGNPLEKEPLVRVTGAMTVGFQAKDSHGDVLAADNVTAKFDQEYSASGADHGMVSTVKHTFKHLTKGGLEEDTAPSAEDLQNRLVQDAARQIAAYLVNTTEEVEVLLARGGQLDQADKLAENKLWSRALETLETMKPFARREDDAYRLYDLGVVNEALAYEAQDVRKASTYLQAAAIDYGKAIDAKPAEQYFLQPQTRIDSAIAHYRVLGQQIATPNRTGGRPVPGSLAETPAAASATGIKTEGTAGASGDTLTNDGVIALVAAKVDEANVLETIRDARSVKFDLGVQGQVELSKNGVSGRILTAMKQRAARARPTHHAATKTVPRTH